MSSAVCIIFAFSLAFFLRFGDLFWFVGFRFSDSLIFLNICVLRRDRKNVGAGGKEDGKDVNGV